MDINAWEGLDVYNNLGDVFLPDGRTSAVFTTPWWRCGKWCKIVIETGDAPLTVEKTEFAETRAPAAVAAARHCRNGCDFSHSRVTAKGNRCYKGKSHPS